MNTIVKRDTSRYLVMRRSCRVLGRIIMDYSTFKNELFKYLNVEIFEANDRIYFELDPQYSYRNKELFVFDNEEFEELFNFLPRYQQEENYFLESDKNFEVFLSTNDVWRPSRHSYQSVEVTDSTLEIKYTISELSKAAVFYLLYKRVEDIGYPERFGALAYFENMDFRSRRRVRLQQIEFDNNAEYRPFLEFLSEQIVPYYYSLKISSEKPCTIDVFKQYKDSFVFTYIYNKHRPIVEADSLNKIGENRGLLGVNRNDIEAPKRRYDPYVIEYYRQASESSDPFIQFISYYHILEYFYDEVFNKKLVDDMMERITHPNFSYRNRDQLKKLAEFSHKRLKGFGEDGQGNELESLKYVLKEYVNIEELKQRLQELRQDITYYENNNVDFSKGPKLKFNDDGVYTAMAKRIYFTRNSLIHSKSNRKSQTYRVSTHRDILKNEIPMLEAISELVILNSSEIM